MQTSDPYTDIAGELLSLQLFRGISPAQIKPLAAAASRRRYGRTELVLGPHSDDAEGLYVITDGGARLFRLSPSGQEITLATLTRGDIFGLVFLAPSRPPLSSVEAVMDGTVMHRFPRGAFQEFMARYPEVAVHALGLVSLRLAEAYNLIEDLALHDVRTRLARALVRLARQSPNSSIQATHEEIAVLVGTNRERVTKLLRSFREQGLVRSAPHRRGLLIPDPDLLEELQAD